MAPKVSDVVHHCRHLVSCHVDLWMLRG